MPLRAIQADITGLEPDAVVNAANERLASACRSALALLHGAGGRSIAFPAIFTGIFGYPPAEAARVALATLREDLVRHGELHVTFACFGAGMPAFYEKELAV